MKTNNEIEKYIVSRLLINEIDISKPFKNKLKIMLKFGKNKTFAGI